MNIYESQIKTLPHIGEPAKIATLEHYIDIGVISKANWNNLTDEVRTELLKVLNDDK